jgi:hypothetical protein
MQTKCHPPYRKDLNQGNNECNPSRKTDTNNPKADSNNARHPKTAMGGTLDLRGVSFIDQRFPTGQSETDKPQYTGKTL